MVFVVNVYLIFFLTFSPKRIGSPARNYGKPVSVDTVSFLSKLFQEKKKLKKERKVMWIHSLHFSLCLL
jgi:hypothetical protein